MLASATRLPLCLAFVLVCITCAECFIAQESVQNGVVYNGVAILGDRNVYVLDLGLDRGISNVEIQIRVANENSAVLPCPSIVDFSDVSILPEEVPTTCNANFNGDTMTVKREILRSGRYYIHVDPIFAISDEGRDKSEIFVFYSLEVSWQECEENLWGAECSVLANSLIFNEEALFRITGEDSMQILSIQMTGEENFEVEMLAKLKSSGNRKLCVLYQHGTPMIPENANYLAKICSEDSLSHTVEVGTRGNHFFTFFAYGDSAPLDFSVLMHKNYAPVIFSQPILTDAIEKVYIDSQESHLLYFEVSDMIQELEIELEQLSSIELSKLEFTLVPAFESSLEDVKVHFSLLEKSTIRLIAPVSGKWLLSISSQAIQKTHATLSVSIKVSKETSQVQTITEHNEGLVHLSSTWSFFEVLASRGRSNAHIEIEEPGTLLFALCNADAKASTTNFDKFSANGKLLLPIDYSSDSCWRVTAYNSETKNTARKTSNISMKQVTAQIQTGDPTNGADTRVSIFIWTSLISCGGLLVICTIAFFVWAKRAWKGLKESGAYEMLRAEQ